jgi:TfoX N-terminal domain
MTAADAFEQLAEELAPRGVTTGAMFGKQALMAEGKAIACLKDDMLAFRLGAGTGAHTEALDLPGTTLFDPSGKKRPFKDWVAVPAQHKQQWHRLAEQALDALTRP